MSRRCLRGVLLAVALMLLAVGCGSRSGSGVAASVSRPAQAPTTADAVVRPPVTDAPTEAPVAPTPAPATEPAATPAPAPATTSPTTVSNDSSSVWWPWLLVVLAVVAVVIAVIALMRRSPKTAATASAVPTSQTSQTASVLGQTDEITTHLVGLAPGVVGSVAGADANRLAVLMATVAQLTTTAPDELSRNALAGLYDSMRALHAALDATALTPYPLTEADAAELRTRATALHSATGLARATMFPPLPGSPL